MIGPRWRRCWRCYPRSWRAAGWPLDGSVVARREAGYSPVRASATRNRPLQLLVGHCDTVWPVGMVRQMPVRVEDETLFGPGVFDMKGGLVQMVTALRCLKDLGLQPPADCVAVINSDEEIGSPDSTPLIRRLAPRSVRAYILEPAFGRSGKLKTAPRPPAASRSPSRVEPPTPGSIPKKASARSSRCPTRSSGCSPSTTRPEGSR